MVVSFLKQNTVFIGLLTLVIFATLYPTVTKNKNVFVKTPIHSSMVLSPAPYGVDATVTLTGHDRFSKIKYEIFDVLENTLSDPNFGGLNIKLHLINRQIIQDLDITLLSMATNERVDNYLDLHKAALQNIQDHFPNSVATATDPNIYEKTALPHSKSTLLHFYVLAFVFSFMVAVIASLLLQNIRKRRV